MNYERQTRITPARAGKTELPDTGRNEARDHPRSCGKDFLWNFEGDIVKGSPPLVRERLIDGVFLRQVDRITPARAGKTYGSSPCWPPIGDHPRSCGKDQVTGAVLLGSLGSPPLVRERQVQRSCCRMWWRITPARAGKTKRGKIQAFFLVDHPRSCGKDSAITNTPFFNVGSPPLVRERHTDS